MMSSANTLPAPSGTARWGTGRRGPLAAALLLVAALLVAAAPAMSGDLQRVIVRGAGGSAGLAETAVESVGGRVELPLRVIDGFVAQVPADRLGDLRTVDGITSVTPDAPLPLQGTVEDGEGATTIDAAELVNAPYLWDQGYTGAGVGVALIDSGTVPVEGLTDGVVHGPDLSFEGVNPGLRHLDTYGHGTHLAGIIAGRDSGWSAPGDPGFVGVAPDATLVSVKVAVANGFADVSQVIAAIDWVVQHRRDHDIRVLNLAFGTDGVQDYRLDPLTHAVEVAWNRGIVVVTAAGNQGFGDGRLDDPAYDPFVLAVGAGDPAGTKPTHDDVIPEWSSRGDGDRNPDLVAPGASVVSLRDPGSFIDRKHPSARVGTRFTRGSGTSQAAAVVSGAVALLLDQRPDLTPDQVKDLLVRTARPLPAADPVGQGAGLVDVREAAQASARQVSQSWQPAAGVGLVDSARGTVRPVADAVDTLLSPLTGGSELLSGLTGEVDASGSAWNAVAWSQAATDGSTWTSGDWSGSYWGGGSWNGNSWSGNSWSGNSWSGNSWSGVWTGNSWSGEGWTGNSWSDAAWSTAGWG